MVRYPLYKGGFIILPEPAVTAMYIIEKASKLNKDEQLKLLNLGVAFDIAVSDLNDSRLEFLKYNGLDFPDSVSEVIEILKSAGAITEHDERFEINYTGSINYSKFELNPSTIETISYARSFIDNSPEMMDYLNSLDIVDLTKKDSCEPYVLLSNDLLEDGISPREAVDRASFVHEVSQLKKHVDQYIKESSDEEDSN
ncbi:MAG: hypothetical protein IBX70_07675 [Clostridia bacterium]|nr:hypothetical protein [Clostridia bacterium]